MKRVVAFTNLFPRPWEPQRATFNRQQLERLAQHYDLEVLVPVSWLDWLQARRQGLDTSSPVSRLAVRYFSYFYTPKFFRWSYGASLLLSTLRVLPRILGRHRPTVIYTPWAYPDGWVAVLLGRLLGIPVVIKVLGSDINELPKLAGVRPQITWVLRHAAAVIAVSQDLAEKVIALGATVATTQVIYDGVDPARFKRLEQKDCREQLALRAQGKVIVYVGNLLATKGCLDLIESFAALKQQQPDTLLVYVGKGEACAAKLVARAEALGLKGSVKLVGVQPHEVVASWMGAADVVVLPSYNEGVPNVLLEAMACGKPIVATQVGGIPEVVPAFAGILVVPGDIAALTAALRTALTTIWDVNKIIAHVSQFTWERNIAELQAVLDSKANT